MAWSRTNRREERGDTLIEVTFALAILCVVLLSATAIATTAFRTGMTATERTQVANQAQAQMEALRSFRDNHTWTEFRLGSGVLYAGVDTASLSTACVSNPARKCFHMELRNTTAGTTEWVPIAGPMNGAAPTSQLEIWADNTAPFLAARPCDYDFQLDYQFIPAGTNQLATNHISTRLANLKYQPVAGGCLP